MNLPANAWPQDRVPGAGSWGLWLVLAQCPQQELGAQDWQSWPKAFPGECAKWPPPRHPPEPLASSRGVHRVLARHPRDTPRLRPPSLRLLVVRSDRHPSLCPPLSLFFSLLWPCLLPLWALTFFQGPRMREQPHGAACTLPRMAAWLLPHGTAQAGEMVPGGCGCALESTSSHGLE